MLATIVLVLLVWVPSVDRSSPGSWGLPHTYDSRELTIVPG